MNIAFVIPTRNRPQAAIDAIRALLSGQTANELTVLVSDNSAAEADVRLLSDFCLASGDPRLLYVRPPVPLNLAEHWDWALEQALARTTATHFNVHYDRKVLKQHAAERLSAVCARHPATLVTFPTDFTVALPGGFGGWQYPGTGKEFEIQTSCVIAVSAHGNLDEIGQAMPLLSNCVVPRTILERVRSTFGSICNSATPDAAFTYRFCSIEPRYVQLDTAVGVMYAFNLSNGLAYFRGDTSAAYGDFTRLWGNRPWLELAPIPGLDLGYNILYHEYMAVQRVVGEGLLPPIDLDAYLRQLARGLKHITDPAEQARLRHLLMSRGWKPDVPPHEQSPGAGVRRRRRGAAALLRAIARRLLRLVGVQARPAIPAVPVSATETEAIQFLLSHALPPVAVSPVLTRMQPRELPSPS